MYKHLTPQEISEFEKDFGGGDESGDYPSKAILSFIDTLIGKREQDLLERYNHFLLRHGYVDSDIWGEEPTAIDRFLSPEVLNHNQH